MKIKIIKSPYFSTYHGFEYLPPLSMAGLYSFLKSKGFDIVQEDLDVCPGHENKKKRLKEIRELYLRPFLDSERMFRYLEGGNDGRLDALVNRCIGQNTFEGMDVLLISVQSQDFFSSMTALLIARYFKMKNRNKPVIIGGEWGHCSYIYDKLEIYNSIGLIDYYVVGHGEEPLYLLLKKLQGDPIDFRDIPGLCYRENGKTYTPSRFSDQVLTVPDFEGLNMASYTWNNASVFKTSKYPFPDIGILMLPIRLVYGCANRCSFCSSNNYKKLYYMEPKEAAACLESLSKRYNTPYFFFMDDELNVSEDFVNAFCDEILRLGLKIYWTACATAKQISSAETLKKMRRAGACRLIFGLETASPRLLCFVNKNVEIEHVSRVLKWSHEAGIWTGLEIIAGLPYETSEDVCLTADFIHAHHQYLDMAWLNQFFLCFGSDMFNFPRKFGIKNIKDYYRFSKILKADLECHRYSYEEINGLSWQDKRRQMNNSWWDLARILFDYRLLYGLRDETNALFYLYTCFSDKNEIKKRYQELYADKIWK